MDSHHPIPTETIESCRKAIGRQREYLDSLAPENAERLSVLLGQDGPVDLLPPTFHWVYFNPAVPADKMGHDMHEQTGAFLPAAPFNRRMWAGGDVTVMKPLRIGKTAQKRSTIKDVAFKQGRSGQMCFATVQHEIEQAGTPCIREIQTIVYRDRGEPEQETTPPHSEIPVGYFRHPDHQLFFYSALTHNGHRIHWDRDFCRDVEGYPDLVVHGPLMATELCEAMRNAQIAPMRFTYRAQAPVFVSTAVTIETTPDCAERNAVMKRLDGVTSMAANLSLL